MPDRITAVNDRQVQGYTWKDGTGSFDWPHLAEQLEELEGNEFAIEVKRDMNDGKSFSAEAIESLARACMTFVLAQCNAHWKEHHEPPSKLKLLFHIELDHERKA